MSNSYPPLTDSNIHGAVDIWVIRDDAVKAEAIRQATYGQLQNITDDNIKTAVGLWCTASSLALAKGTYGHIKDWDTSLVTNMSMLFSGQTTFNDDIGEWNTSNVTDMQNMFSGCDKFNKDISSWVTTNVTDMQNMFNGAIAFNQDLSLWEVPFIASQPNGFATGATLFVDAIFLPHWGKYRINIEGPRYTLAKKDSIYIEPGASGTSYQITVTGTVDTAVAGSTHTIVYSATAAVAGKTHDSYQIRYVTVVEQLITQSNIQAAVTQWCDASTRASAELTYGHIKDWDTSLVTDMSLLFNGKSLFNDNIGGWNTSNVTNMLRMFHNCLLFNQDIGEWNVSKVTNMEYFGWKLNSFFQDLSRWRVPLIPNKPLYMTVPIFTYDATHLPVFGYIDMTDYGPITVWDTSSVTNMDTLFHKAEGFNEDIGAWDTSLVTSMGAMFQGASAFNQDISGWSVGNVISMGAMFQGASAFNQDIGDWDTTLVTNMSAMFFGASAFNQDISGWDVGKVNNMNYMFANASAFNQDIGKWDVGNVTTMKGMFKRSSSASAFNQDIGEWDVGNVTIMEDMFNGAFAFNQDISGWDVGNVYLMTGMFLGASAFNQDLSLMEVPLITSIPINFAKLSYQSATLFSDVSRHPHWGVRVFLTVAFPISFTMVISSIDQSDTVGIVTISKLPRDAVSWAFSSDHGVSWKLGSMTTQSFKLRGGTYAIDAIRIKCTNATGTDNELIIKNTEQIIIEYVSAFTPITSSIGSVAEFTSIGKPEVNLNDTTVTGVSVTEKRNFTSLLIKGLFSANTGKSSMVLKAGATLPGYFEQATDKDIYLFNASNQGSPSDVLSLQTIEIASKQFYVVFEAGDTLNLQTSSDTVNITKLGDVYTITSKVGTQTQTIGYNYVYDGLNIILGSIMGTFTYPPINFYLQGLNEILTLSESANIPSYQLDDISSNATITLTNGVTAAELQNTFFYRTDEPIILDASYVSYYVDTTKWSNYNQTLNPWNGIVTVNPYVQGDNVGKDFLRDLAKQLFGTHLGVDMFTNEQAVYADISSRCDTVATTIITLLQSIDVSGTDTGLGQELDDSGRYFNDNTSQSNISRELFNTMITNAPQRFADVSGSRYNAVEDGFYKIPFVNGDSISFKLTMFPSTEQDDAVPTRGAGTAALKARSYTVTLNVVT